MTLAAQLAADLEAVFFAEGGFSASLKINGASVRAVSDDTEESGGDAWQDGEPSHGLRQQARTLRVPATDMPKPLVGQEMEINGEWWTVQTSGEEDGMLLFTLVRAAS